MVKKKKKKKLTTYLLLFSFAIILWLHIVKVLLVI